MATQRTYRRWLLTGILCLSAGSVGCSTWSWNPQVRAKRNLKDPVGTHLAEAQWMEHVGDLKHARESYNFVLDEDPQSADAILGIARLDHLAERHEAAEEGFQKALKLDPKNPAVLYAVGEYYAATERMPEAIKLLNEAALAAPDEPSYRFHLAVAMAQNGDVEGAMPHFVRSVGTAEAHYNIGYILHQKGQAAAAERQYALALKSNPQLSEAQRMLDEISRDKGKMPLKETQIARTAPGWSEPLAGASASPRMPVIHEGGVQQVSHTEAAPRVTPQSSRPTSAAAAATPAVPVVTPGQDSAAQQPASSEPALWQSSPRVNGQPAVPQVQINSAAPAPRAQANAVTVTPAGTAAPASATGVEQWPGAQKAK